MFPPMDHDYIKRYYCWGEVLTTLVDGNRLRFKDEVMAIFTTHKIKSLWRYPDPTDKKIILCPLEFQLLYFETAQKQLTQEVDTEALYRNYICAGTPGRIDRYHRIKLNKVCLKRASLEEGQCVTLLGIGPWFELYPAT